MKILFLDDNPMHHDMFGRSNACHHITYALTYDDAINTLQNNPFFDVLYLDEDLQDCMLPHDGEPVRTSLDLAEFIVTELTEEKRPRIIILRAP